MSVCLFDKDGQKGGHKLQVTDLIFSADGETIIVFVFVAPKNICGTAPLLGLTFLGKGKPLHTAPGSEPSIGSVRIFLGKAIQSNSEIALKVVRRLTTIIMPLMWVMVHMSHEATGKGQMLATEYSVTASDVEVCLAEKADNTPIFVSLCHLRHCYPHMSWTWHIKKRKRKKQKQDDAVPFLYLLIRIMALLRDPVQRTS